MGRLVQASTEVISPIVPAWAEPVWHLFVIRSKHRDALQQHLASRGVGTVIHYPIPPHLQPAYAELACGVGAYPLAETIHREVLSLPMGPTLATDDVRYVCEAITSFGRPSV